MEIDILDLCETVGCTNEAEKITSSETKIIQVCLDCFTRKYATVKVSEIESYFKKDSTYDVKMPYVIKNFFNEQELDLSKQYVKYLLSNRKFVEYDPAKKKENAGSWVINHFVGRINIMLPASEIPNDFIGILERYKNQINSKAKLDGVEVVIYSNMYGNPRIDPHIDPPSKRDFMFNIQLDSNINWPISEYIENQIKTTVLNNNECLVMDVVKYVHWREPIKLNDGEYMAMVFVYFDDEQRQPYPDDWYPHPPEWKRVGMEIHSEYSNKMSLLYPEDHDDYDKIKERIVGNYKNIDFYNPLKY